MTTNSQKLKRNWKANIHMQGKQRYIYTPSHAPRGWVGDHHSPPRLFYFHKILIYALQKPKVLRTGAKHSKSLVTCKLAEVFKMLSQQNENKYMKTERRNFAHEHTSRLLML